MTVKSLRSAIYILIFFLAVSPVMSAVYYVKPAGNDSYSGTSWASAKKTVQSAVTAAPAGSEVWVASGTYFGQVALKAGVSIYGGFAGTETSRTQRDPVARETTLNGNAAGSVITVGTGASITTVIDGFTIRNGKASVGGGIYCSGASPTISNNVITGNITEGSGNPPPPEETSLTTRAATGGQGAGIYLLNSSPKIIGNEIYGNTASAEGGAIYCENSSPAISNNLMSGNVAAYGAGINLYSGSSARIAGNIIIANAASKIGGGIYCYLNSTAVLVNNTILQNEAPVAGGVYVSSSSPTVANNIITFNTAGYYQKSGSPTIAANCVFGNLDGNYWGISDPTGTNGNISADPDFIDEYDIDFHLPGNSPCVNKGNGAYINQQDKDYDGEARVFGAAVDIGADEYTSARPANVSLSPNKGGLATTVKTTLTSTYSDADGFLDVAGCYLLINSSLVGSNAIYLRYDLKTMKLYLRNDAGTGWLGGFAMGSANTIENKQCIVYCAETNKHGSSDKCTINWRIQIKPLMLDKTCSAWMLVQDGSGLQDGWDAMGSFTVTNTPFNDSFAPSSGTIPTGVKTVVTTAYSDPEGYANLSGCYALINSTLTGLNGVYLCYSENTNKLYLRNDANTAWLGSAVPGSSTVIENSRCKVYCAETVITKNGTQVTINWKVEFKPLVAGKTLTAWMLVEDEAKVRDGWDKMGTLKFTLPNQAPVNVSLTPSSGTLAANVKLTLTSAYSDPDGYTDLAGCYTLINTTLTGLNGIYLCYSENANKIYLRNDSNTAWLTGLTPGSAGTVENSYCRVYAAESTVSKSGSGLTIDYKILIKSPMSNKNCSAWMLVEDDDKVRDGWDKMGSLSVR